MARPLAIAAAGPRRIVNIASMAALRGLPNLASYSAAKGGVVGLTQQAAFDYMLKHPRHADLSGAR